MLYIYLLTSHQSASTFSQTTFSIEEKYKLTHSRTHPQYSICLIPINKILNIIFYHIFINLLRNRKKIKKSSRNKLWSNYMYPKWSNYMSIYFIIKTLRFLCSGGVPTYIHTIYIYICTRIKALSYGSPEYLTCIAFA